MGKFTPKLKEGEYVVATKYSDADPRDGFCVGFFRDMTNHNPPRYNIVDVDGNLFRGNSFRAAKRISQYVGSRIIADSELIEKHSRASIWKWVKEFQTQELTTQS